MRKTSEVGKCSVAVSDKLQMSVSKWKYCLGEAEVKA